MRSVGTICQIVGAAALLGFAASARAEEATLAVVSVAIPVGTATASLPQDMDGDDEGDDRPAIRFGRAVDLAGRDIDPGAGALADAGPFRTGAPLRSLRLTSGFGQRQHPILGGSRFHAGVDLSAAMGTPVYAASPGRVEIAGYAGGYGIMVAIAHGGSRSTRYAHLSAVSVRAGEVVQQGQVIGYVGSTGRSTGAHLHFELREGGRPVDPLPYWRGG